MRVLAATTLALALAAASAQIRIVPLPGAEVALPDDFGTVSSCGASGDHASDVKVTLTPSNPKPGQDFNLTSSYTLDEEVTGGKATYKGARALGCATLKLRPHPAPRRSRPERRHGRGPDQGPVQDPVGQRHAVPAQQGAAQQLLN